MPFVWTEDNVAELKRLWETGESCSVIGRAMGISRNAVIGKVHRLRLGQRAPRLFTDEDLERRRQERNVKERERYRRNRVIGAKKMKELPPAPPQFVGSLNIPFAELRPLSSSAPNQCRYIAAEPGGPDYLACGNETLPGDSWCGHCRQIVYTKANMTQEERALHIHRGVRNHHRAQRRAA